MEKHDQSYLLYVAEFPIYGMAMVSATQFLVSGGGGHSKYGVQNLLQLVDVGEGNSIGKMISSHESGEHAINQLHFTSRGSYVAASQEDSLCLISLKGNNFGVKKSIVTDCDAEDPHQTCSVFSKSGRIVVTGGEEGKVKAFFVPKLSLVFDTNLEKRVESVVYNNSNLRLAVAMGDEGVAVLQSKDGKVIKTLKWKKGASQKLCTFFSNASTPAEMLITVASEGRANASVLLLWRTDSWELVGKEKKVCTAPISCITTNAKGTLVAVGDVSGCVTICDTQEFKVQTRSKPHSLFVTNIFFKAVEKKSTQANKEAATNAKIQYVLSSSADQTVMLTPVMKKGSTQKLIFILSALLIAILAIVLLKL
eukprot:m.19400 g.19400  ORF g.19400 m.19400 type:complete len:366 (-) comp5109_c0_seq1:960-2057(-)